MTVNLAALPSRPVLPKLAPADDDAIDRAAAMIAKSARLQSKPEVGRAVTMPLSGDSRRPPGLLWCCHPARLACSGRARAEHACRRFERLNQRQLCHGRNRASDRHGLARRLPGGLFGDRLQNAQAVININGDLADALHYNKTVALIGDISAVTNRLAAKSGSRGRCEEQKRLAQDVRSQKSEWAAYKRKRFECAPLRDEVWQKPVLPQPAAIKIVADFAKEIGAAKFF